MMWNEFTWNVINPCYPTCDTKDMISLKGNFYRVLVATTETVTWSLTGFPPMNYTTVFFALYLNCTLKNFFWLHQCYIRRWLLLKSNFLILPLLFKTLYVKNINNPKCCRNTKTLSLATQLFKSLNGIPHFQTAPADPTVHLICLHVLRLSLSLTPFLSLGWYFLDICSWQAQQQN